MQRATSVPSVHAPAAMRHQQRQAQGREDGPLRRVEETLGVARQPEEGQEQRQEEREGEQAARETGHPPEKRVDSHAVSHYRRPVSRREA